MTSHVHRPTQHTFCFLIRHLRETAYTVVVTTTPAITANTETGRRIIIEICELLGFNIPGDICDVFDAERLQLCRREDATELNLDRVMESYGDDVIHHAERHNSFLTFCVTVQIQTSIDSRTPNYSS